MLYCELYGLIVIIRTEILMVYIHYINALRTNVHHWSPLSMY